jgi:hypothetical protein
MILAAKFALGAVGTMALAGVWVAHEGAVRVSVDQDRPGGEGHHIHLIVPASVVPPVFSLAISNEHLRRDLKHAQEWMPVAQIACEELAKLPDTELVDVRNDEEHVRVSTHDGKMYVDVDNRDEHVHVSFPLGTAEKVAREIQELGPTT